jgi:hypothetical protein
LGEKPIGGQMSWLHFLILLVLIAFFVIFGNFLRKNDQKYMAKLGERHLVDRKKCFDGGGIRFEYGVSGGNTHMVCVFDK